MIVLYRDYLSIKYYSSNLFSVAFAVNYFLIKLTLTIPFIVIYKSGGLWQKVDFHQEQPDIKFKHDLFLIMEFENQNYFWTNLANFQMDNDFIKIPSINNIEYDHNDDNLNDELKLVLNIRSTSDNKLKSIRCLLAFDFKVKKNAYLQMEGIIDLKIDTNANNYIIYRSAVSFRQRTLLDTDSRTIIKNVFELEKILNDVDAFVSDYNRSNYTIGLVDKNLEFKKDEIKNRYKIQVNLDYPSIVFQIKPRFWTIIKNAWIQYLAIFVIVYAVIHKVRQIIFKEQLVQSDVRLSENLLNVQRYFYKKF